MTTNTLENLMAKNATIISAYVLIQQAAELTNKSTLELECALLESRGKERLYLPQLATKLTGYYISRIGDVVAEQAITAYIDAGVSKSRTVTQSLNASVKMVALYSVLMSGFTDAKTIASALANWLDTDKISLDGLPLVLDCDAVSLDLLTAMINADILSSELGQARTEDGAYYQAHGVTDIVNAHRIASMQELWDKAPPRMQPMLHAVTWGLDGTCELKNLRLVNGQSRPTADFIEAFNLMGHTGYIVNEQVQTDLTQWLELGEYPEVDHLESIDALRVIGKYDDKVRIVEELVCLPLNTVMFFPHTADYRGRAYSRGGLTHFQSIKECKAIFDFVAPAVITDPKGLYLHVANAHGMDKISINARVKWVQDNKQAIMSLSLASDIYARRSALALTEYDKTGETGVICHIDGTCNGTQWTAAIYRDAKTARLVNVTSATLDDVPFDLYGVIASRAFKLAKGAERTALELFMRDLTKAPIMILGYGASESTIEDTIKEYLADHACKANHKILSKHIMTAIKLEAPALTKLTQNLKRILKANPRHEVTWSMQDLEVVSICLNTEHLDLSGSAYTAKLQGKAQHDTDALSRGISPNYIHSLDSAHLRAVVRNAGCSLSCIHDSIGAPANMVMQVNKVIRQEFHSINQTDQVANIYKALGQPYTDQRGTLDIGDVLNAPYIFS